MCQNVYYLVSEKMDNVLAAFGGVLCKKLPESVLPCQ